MTETHYYLKPLPEDDGVIFVTLERIPRWKESELSGDEWRFTNIATIGMKDWENGGTEIVTKTRRNFAEMALMTAAALAELGHYGKQHSVPYSVKNLNEIRVCFQPGCAAVPINMFQIIQEWTWHPNQGFRMERATRRGGEEPIMVRAFCEQHSHRGDASLEDADRNYELLATFPNLEEL